MLYCFFSFSVFLTEITQKSKFEIHQSIKSSYQLRAPITNSKHRLSSEERFFFSHFSTSLYDRFSVGYSRYFGINYFIWSKRLGRSMISFQSISIRLWFVWISSKASLLLSVFFTGLVFEVHLLQPHYKYFTTFGMNCVKGNWKFEWTNVDEILRIENQSAKLGRRVV